jgi:hypothetical protein
MDQTRRGYDAGRLVCDGGSAAEDNQPVADWSMTLRRGATIKDRKVAACAEEFSLRGAVKKSSGVTQAWFAPALSEGPSPLDEDE